MNILHINLTSLPILTANNHLKELAIVTVANSSNLNFVQCFRKCNRLSFTFVSFSLMGSDISSKGLY